jgi:hypothetical protein
VSSGALPLLGVMPAGYGASVNTNTAGQVRLVVVVTAQPKFTGTALAGTNLIFGGTNGTASGNFYVLASTNLAETNWIRIATNQFTAAGTFNFTNAIPPGVPQRFYRLQIL